MKISSNNPKRGFTLIELLVAMAITTIIVTVLVSVTGMALDTWNRSRAEIRAARQAKSMIDTMARDFESFVSRKGNTFEWLHARSNPSTEGPKGIPSPNAIDLVFFSAATDRYNGMIGSGADLGGDVSAVGYRLTYKDPIAGASNDEYKTFVLYRKLVDPKETFEKILGRPSIKAPFDAAGVSPIENEANFICENVYQFTVTFHVSTTTASGLRTVAVPIGRGGSMVENFSLSGSAINTTFAPPPSLGVSNAQLLAGRLSAAEISITVLSDFGIQQMRRRSDLTGTKLTDFIAEHSYQYSKVVQLPGS